MGINNFESVLIYKKITEKMIIKQLLKTIVLLLMWIISIIQIENIEIISLLTQIVFSADIMLDLFSYNIIE